MERVQEVPGGDRARGPPHGSPPECARVRPARTTDRRAGHAHRRSRLRSGVAAARILASHLAREGIPLPSRPTRRGSSASPSWEFLSMTLTTSIVITPAATIAVVIQVIPRSKLEHGAVGAGRDRVSRRPHVVDVGDRHLVNARPLGRRRPCHRDAGQAGKTKGASKAEEPTTDRRPSDAVTAGVSHMVTSPACAFVDWLPRPDEMRRAAPGFVETCEVATAGSESTPVPHPCRDSCSWSRCSRMCAGGRGSRPSRRAGHGRTRTTSERQSLGGPGGQSERSTGTTRLHEEA